MESGMDSEPTPPPINPLPPAPAPPPPAPAATPVAPVDPVDRQWLVALHLCPLIGLIIPFGNMVAPLVLWLIKRPESAVIDQTGKEVLNFQISVFIYAVVSLVLCMILIGFLLLFGVFVLWIYGIIMGAVKAGNGEPFRYPLTLTLLR